MVDSNDSSDNTAENLPDDILDRQDPQNPFHMAGFKRACIIVTVDRESNQYVDGGFQGHAISSVYRSRDYAVCEKRLTHAVPDANCTCGFHALKERSAIEDMKFVGANFRTSPGSSAILEVELFGSQVIEGSTGFRAAAQSVQDVALAGNCRFFFEKATCVVPGDRVGSSPQGDMFAMDSLCDSCAHERGVAPDLIVSPAQLSAIVKTPCHFDEVFEIDVASKKAFKQATITAYNTGGALPGISALFLGLVFLAVMGSVIVLNLTVVSPNIVPDSLVVPGPLYIILLFMLILVIAGLTSIAMSLSMQEKFSRLSMKLKIVFASVLLIALVVSSSSLYLMILKMAEPLPVETVFVEQVEPFQFEGDAREFLFGISKLANAGVDSYDSSDPVSSVEDFAVFLGDSVSSDDSTLVFTQQAVFERGEVSVAFGENEVGDIVRATLATPTSQGGCAFRQIVVSREFSTVLASVGGDVSIMDPEHGCDASQATMFLNPYNTPPSTIITTEEDSNV